MPKAGTAVAQTVAQLAVLESWARTPDRAARTAPARDARWQKYLERARQLAPEGADQADVEYRADCLRKADMHRLALASAKARAARKSGGAGDDRAA
jgi:hypothetical protein